MDHSHSSITTSCTSTGDEDRGETTTTRSSSNNIIMIRNHASTPTTALELTRTTNINKNESSSSAAVPLWKDVSSSSIIITEPEDNIVEQQSRSAAALPPSNETLLGTAFVSFTSFALLQMFFAFVAGSAAMKGDSAAMLVDSLTYLFNYIAEVKKNAFDSKSDSVFQTLPSSADISNHDEHYDCEEDKDQCCEKENTTRGITTLQQEQQLFLLREREKRKMTLQLEILPPVISVCALVVITIFVMRKSIQVLVLDLHRSQSEQLRPNIGLMMGFSIFNLGLDFLNVFCFAKAKHLFGYATKEEHEHKHHPGDYVSHHESVQRRNADHNSYNQITSGSTCCNVDTSQDEDSSSRDLVRDGEVLDENRSPSIGMSHGDANLNMCSAYTHVFADTLRSIAVIVAAAIAFTVPGITPEEADATAAVIVSILILLSLMPLLQGLAQSVKEYRAILKEEKANHIEAIRIPSHQIV